MSPVRFVCGGSVRVCYSFEKVVFWGAWHLKLTQVVWVSNKAWLKVCGVHVLVFILTKAICQSKSKLVLLCIGRAGSDYNFSLIAIEALFQHVGVLPVDSAWRISRWSTFKWLVYLKGSPCHSRRQFSGFVWTPHWGFIKNTYRRLFVVLTNKIERLYTALPWLTNV